MIEIHKPGPPYDFHGAMERELRDAELATLRARIATLEAQVEQAREALENIADYWNRDRNDEAMHDACWHAIETATNALQALREGGEGNHG